MPGTAGSLVTSAGTWTFGTATNAYGNAILLNGQTTAVGWGTEIEVANGNQLYADNPGGWYQWTGSGWSGTSNPTPAGGGRVLTVGPGQQYSTIAAAINASQNGDTIDVQAGTYLNDFAIINTNIWPRYW